MAKSFEVRMSYDHPLAEVFAMYCDDDYIAKRLTGTGGTDIAAEVTVYDDDSVSVVAERTLPSAVPGFAASLVGDSIRVVETHEWDAPTGDGSRTGTIATEFTGLPVAMSGTLALRQVGDTTEFVMAANGSSSVPLFGGKLEDLLREQVERAAHKEERIGREWLAER